MFVSGCPSVSLPPGHWAAGRGVRRCASAPPSPRPLAVSTGACAERCTHAFQWRRAQRAQPARRRRRQRRDPRRRRAHGSVRAALEVHDLLSVELFEPRADSPAAHQPRCARHRRAEAIQPAANAWFAGLPAVSCGWPSLGQCSSGPARAPVRGDPRARVGRVARARAPGIRGSHRRWSDRRPSTRAALPADS